MSRRKQARPSRHLESEDEANSKSTAIADQNKKDLTNGRKDMRKELMSWDGKRERIESSTSNDGEFEEDEFDMDQEELRFTNKSCRSLSEDDDMHTEDANNNEAKNREISLIKGVLDFKEGTKDPMGLALQSILGANFPWPAGLAGPNVTLEAIENTKLAVAQFAGHGMNYSGKSAAKIPRKNGLDASHKPEEDLENLHSTLFTLQQQQLLQLQLLQHLQHQLISKSSQNSLQPEDSSSPNSPSSVHSTSSTPTPSDLPNGLDRSGTTSSSPLKSSSSSSASHSPSAGKRNGDVKGQNGESSSKENEGESATVSGASASRTEGISSHFASLLNCGNQDPNQPLSPGLSTMISSNSILSPDGGPQSGREPNTLEMLQKRTQEVLDSASQGLLASSLVDDPNYRRKGVGLEKGREPFFKHQCRFCGKVFSSDSALQIHIRSHTGERPFKCNVCGSRFTTKGNLKVHFQRHTQRFPHVRMNPHPVPEHLDHLHPPLRPNSGHSTPSHSPTGSNSFRTPPPPAAAAFQSFSPLFHISQSMKFMPLTVPMFPKEALHAEKMMNGGGAPEDLTKPRSKSNGDASQSVEKKEVKKEVASTDDSRDENDSTAEEEDEKMDDDDNTNSQNGDDRRSPGRERKRTFSGDSDDNRDDHDEDDGGNQHKDDDNDCSMDSNGQEQTEQTDDDSMALEDSSQDQPENLSSKSLPLMYPLPLLVQQQGRPSSASSMPFQNISPSSHSLLNHNSPFGKQLGLPSEFDPAKDPAIYTNLLPRPGSNDNAWESLIEVTKTSETAKLQQLVDNIDHKVTDPNQCIICHRILSCKSALQMHYRTHTGERPFKCKICGRTFTTKGNLKTHMGVHRAKPPLRALLQCPVCHKRFTNSLVLQQHIRLHTGEPTTLSPEQIRAAEVKDFCLFPGGQFGQFPMASSQFLSHANANLLRRPSLTPSPTSNRLQAEPLISDAKSPKDDSNDEEESPLRAQMPVKENVCSSSNASPAGDSSTGSSEKGDGQDSEPNASPSNSSSDQQFVASSIIPHNNLPFLKVNYVFVK